MKERQKSEVQNLTTPSEATEQLDVSPPAEDTRHVTHGEPKEYDGRSAAVDQADDDGGYPTEGRSEP